MGLGSPQLVTAAWDFCRLSWSPLLRGTFVASVSRLRYGTFVAPVSRLHYGTFVASVGRFRYVGPLSPQLVAASATSRQFVAPTTSISSKQV